MKKYNHELACYQTCGNCTYCNKGNYKFDSVRCNNPKNRARNKWYCEEHESPCADHTEDPTEECCEHWEMY